MNTQFRIAMVDGAKALVVNGRTLLTKQQVADQIAALEDRITRQLPAARMRLDSAQLLAQAQANIDQQILRAADAKAALEAAMAELNEA